MHRALCDFMGRHINRDFCQISFSFNLKMVLDVSLVPKKIELRKLVERYVLTAMDKDDAVSELVC